MRLLCLIPLLLSACARAMDYTPLENAVTDDSLFPPLNPRPRFAEINRFARTLPAPPAKRQGHTAGCDSNADCMRKRMPLLPPNRRPAGTGALRPRQSSCATTTYTGYIQAIDSSGNNLGYLKNTRNRHGFYGSYGTTIGSTTLIVSYTICPTDSTNQINLLITGGTLVAGYPYLAAVVGGNSPSDNQGSGSSGFSILTAATNALSPGAATQDPNLNSKADSTSYDVETAIWNVEKTSNAITVTWVNTDGSINPATILELTANGVSQTEFTGDFNAYNTAFPTTGTSTIITWTFVPQ